MVAVGGYGRGAMAPYSDIDLLFLRGAKADAGVEAAIQVMLYTLWDLGFKVGHASRTVDECLRFAREDSHHPDLAPGGALGGRATPRWPTP